MAKRKNGSQLGLEAAQRFRGWIDERWRLNDWGNYIRPSGTELSRKEIYTECMFDRGAFKRGKGMGNPAIVELLDETEDKLREQGILKPKNNNEGSPFIKSDVQEKVEQTAQMMRDAQLMKSQEENAMLKARVSELEETLRKYDLMEQHMIDSGRLIRG